MESKNLSQQKVELIPAFSWYCPNCDALNFERAVFVELSPEEMAELRLQHGVEPTDEGQFLTSPRTVCCISCATEFEAVDFGHEEA